MYIEGGSWKSGELLNNIAHDMIELAAAKTDYDYGKSVERPRMP